MSAKIHLSRIRRIGGRTITGTICNRMVGDGEINCTTSVAEVTCKLCLSVISVQQREAGEAA
jgi:hypothetical protein